MNLHIKFKVLRISKNSNKCIIRISKAFVNDVGKKICMKGKIITAFVVQEPYDSEDDDGISISSYYSHQCSDEDDDYDDHCSCHFDSYGLWITCSECRRDYGPECSCRGGCAMCA